jgi:hypothetical protein
LRGILHVERLMRSLIVVTIDEVIRTLPAAAGSCGQQAWLVAGKYRRVERDRAGSTFSSIAARPQARRHAVEESSGFACAKGLSHTWLYDVRVLENPFSISTLPTPTDRSWCRPGGNSGSA